MCNLAPGQAKCILEKFDLTSCHVHELSCAVTELQQALPIIGRHIPDYECPDYEPERKEHHDAAGHGKSRRMDE